MRWFLVAEDLARMSRLSRLRASAEHPFVERLIGTIRRECLDRALSDQRRFRQGLQQLRIRHQQDMPP
jgi:hypothetical protein